jgi:hypothetical protein
MNEFLRVRVELHTAAAFRLNSQRVSEVNREKKQFTSLNMNMCRTFALMGHKKEVCKKWLSGVPSLDYEAYELRCSPYKKFEHRSHFVPPQGQALARRGLSFSSFGSTESCKTWQNRRPVQSAEINKTRASSGRAESDEGLEDMLPLEDIIPGYGGGTVPFGLHGSFDEPQTAREQEVEQTLLSKVNAMQVDTMNQTNPTPVPRSHDAGPYVQFPEEDDQVVAEEEPAHATFIVNQTIYEHVKSASQSGSMGPKSSDMIPSKCQ